jgi:uncharacterized membrane protein
VSDDHGPVVPDPARDNIRTIVELERRSRREQTWSVRVTTGSAGSSGAPHVRARPRQRVRPWAVWNATVAADARFDPYPYGLLTLIVSLEGVLIATFVLITQNRMKQESNQRDRLALQVDLLAEQEMTLVLRMLRRISERLGVPPEHHDAARAEKLTEETNLYELMHRLEQEDKPMGDTQR